MNGRYLQAVAIAPDHYRSLRGRERGATWGCQADDMRISDREMVCPSIASWMIERDDIARLWIDPGKIRAFVKIAMLTGIGRQSDIRGGE
jgi:hypothetical protein